MGGASLATVLAIAGSWTRLAPTRLRDYRALHWEAAPCHAEAGWPPSFGARAFERHIADAITRDRQPSRAPLGPDLSGVGGSSRCSLDWRAVAPVVRPSSIRSVKVVHGRVFTPLVPYRGARARAAPRRRTPRRARAARRVLRGSPAASRPAHPPRVRASTRHSG